MPDTLGRLKRWFVPEIPDEPRAARPRVGTPIAECRPRDRVEVQGTVTALGVNTTTGWYEADLRDDTGSLRLVWMGRRRLECLHEGTEVIARGRLTRRGEALVLYNPEFSVLPA